MSSFALCSERLRFWYGSKMSRNYQALFGGLGSGPRPYAVLVVAELACSDEAVFHRIENFALRAFQRVLSLFKVSAANAPISEFAPWCMGNPILVYLRFEKRRKIDYRWQRRGSGETHCGKGFLLAVFVLTRDCADFRPCQEQSSVVVRVAPTAKPSRPIEGTGSC